jgi:hypothetical protein
MIVLSTTSDTIEVILGAAHTTSALQCVTSWRDIQTSSYTPGRSLASTNGTTAVTLVGSPAASTSRVVDLVSIVNTDTVSHTATFRQFDGTDRFRLFQATILPGEQIIYQDGQGWTAYTAAGAAKTANVANVVQSTSDTVVVIPAAVTNSNATANTLADVTGLSFPVVAGTTYWFTFLVRYTAAVTTTGSRWTINGPASPTLLTYRSYYSLTTTSETLGQIATAYQQPAAANATSIVAGNLAEVTGIIRPSVNGTVQLQFASEVSSSAITAELGSYCRYRAL